MSLADDQAELNRALRELGTTIAAPWVELLAQTAARIGGRTQWAWAWELYDACCWWLMRRNLAQLEEKTRK